MDPEWRPMVPHIEFFVSSGSLISIKLYALVLSGHFDHLASRSDKFYSLCGIIGGLHSGTIPVYYVAKFWEIYT